VTRSGLVAHCVNFCRALRTRGVPVTPAETLLAARTLSVVDIGDREDIRLGLRTVLVLQRDQYPVFDAVFDEMWGGGSLGDHSARSRTTQPPSNQERARVTLETWMRGEDPTREQRVAVRQASDREATGRRDFATFDNEQSAAFERLARRIARRLALRRSRRWKPSPRGARLDLRRTMHGSLRTGGEVVALEWRRRKLRRTRLVAICDVSGSMELYAKFLLQFLHALQNTFARIETFVFSTRLTRTTALLKHARWEEALSGVARAVTDWSGGTRIGTSLAHFVEHWIDLVDRRTVVIVLSDGWDTGDPEVLGAAMEQLHVHAGRVIWLNPLMASPDYAPETRGMQAALPHVDLLAPAHSVESLEKLVRHLAI
jgi:uncharacterized protein with von Willebrand factor type A (vWA) domain